MRLPLSFLLVCLLAAAFVLVHQTSAQRAPRGQVHSLQATSDHGGEHPAKTEISGPATVACLNGVSETRNAPQPSCYVTGPGFKGILAKGKTANLTGAGTVTLTCSGQGNMRCDARVDVPPQSK